MAIQDRGGRSPSRQVNEVADALENFLSRHEVQRHIVRVVAFSHPESAYGDMSELTVDQIRTLSDLDVLGACSADSRKLDNAEVEKIVLLIQKDHEFHVAASQRRQKARIVAKLGWQWMFDESGRGSLHFVSNTQRTTGSSLTDEAADVSRELDRN